MSYFDDKRVFIAGSTGFIGTNLMVRLAKTKAKLVGNIHHTEPQRDDVKIEYFYGDLLCPKHCQDLVRKVDYVFMCAAHTSGAAVIENDPLSHVTPNVIMNTNLLDAAYKAGVKKFLFLSTNTVYPQTNYPVKEKDMMSGPLFEKYFCVGWMKRFTEMMCEMYATKIKNPMTTVIIRPGNTYGEWDDFNFETSHVLPALMRKIIENPDQIEVWGDGNDIKDFIYVDDLVDGMMLAMEKINSFDQFNIASGREATIKEALHMMCKINSRNPNIVYDPSKPTMIPKRLIDVSKAKKDIGFEAKTSLYKGLERTMNWYKRTVK